jgi:2-polyprenyl-3-methyl-5-hydroxy-6-metoxy-1,4-benzoquinol methylase
MKNKTYFTNTRTDILPLIPKSNNMRVLEIGCGCGNTLQFLKSIGICSWACGVELDSWAAEQARQYLDLVLEGNIEHTELLLEHDSIDLILCLDVLEHLVDPWRVIKQIYVLLKPGGCIIVSIPNVRRISILFNLLLLGKWDYTETGILDKTHLRFFVRKTAIYLLVNAGFKIDAILSTGLERGTKGWFPNLITFSIFKDFFTRQYLIKAYK